MMGRLDKKVAIVTGAGCVGPGWGNGRAIATRFIEEGASVFAVDLASEQLEETLAYNAAHKDRIIPYTCDVTKLDQIEAMVGACIAEFGTIDILVNNVGGSQKGGPVELSAQDWQRQIDYNLTSVFAACKFALPHMAEKKSGSIVNIASTSGLRWTGAAQVGYAASKAAVIQLSKVVAVEYASQGVRVNTVVPGQLHTPMVETRLAGQRAGGDVDALLKQRLARIPLGFMGDGRDTANAVLFLASDEARFITGTEIVVDGGMSVRCD
ncbi:MAG: SDR family oxidoreductase [Candidatus Puniceispirillum sp.]|nr:SDR family oxidoreductase [Candidatus Puniceispirillum sp.]